jgi:hypothetical protein
MKTPSKAEDVARLRVIAAELTRLNDLYDERCLIWRRRLDAGDISQSELARTSGVARAVVMHSTKPERVQKAKQR